MVINNTIRKLRRYTDFKKYYFVTLFLESSLVTVTKFGSECSIKNPLLIK